MTVISSRPTWNLIINRKASRFSYLNAHKTTFKSQKLQVVSKMSGERFKDIPDEEEVSGLSYLSEEDTYLRHHRLFHKYKYIITILCVPILLYIFIYLPLSLQPTKVSLPKLKKFDRLQVYLKPINSTISEVNSVQDFEGYYDFETTSQIYNLEGANRISKSRLILIGDVHGCFKQLKQLLYDVKYDSETDAVILLGDFISKGPDSLKVLQYSLEQGFYGILGNHELSVLAKYVAKKELPFDDSDVYTLPLKAGIQNSKYYDELNIARHLTPEQVKYITDMPLVLDIGPVPLNDKKDEYSSVAGGIATHMGILPDNSLKNQNITDLLSIPKQWYKAYRDYEKKLDRSKRNVVYYGHHAGIGLNLHKYTKGLDTGCVYGRELTAISIWSEAINNKVVYKQELISVKC